MEEINSRAGHIFGKRKTVSGQKLLLITRAIEKHGISTRKLD